MKKLFLLGILLISLSVSAQQIDRLILTSMSSCTYNEYTEDWNSWGNHTTIYVTVTINYTNQTITFYGSETYTVKYYSMEQYSSEEAFGNFMFKGYDESGLYVVVIASLLKTQKVSICISYPETIMFGYMGKLIQ